MRTSLALFNHLDDAVVTFDDQRKVTFLNLLAEDLFGVSAPDAVDLSLDKALGIKRSAFPWRQVAKSSESFPKPW